jgi:hypothetical protein
VFKPSPGLEPGTASLPSSNECGNRGHAREIAGTKAAQEAGNG